MTVGSIPDPKTVCDEFISLPISKYTIISSAALELAECSRRIGYLEGFRDTLKWGTPNYIKVQACIDNLWPVRFALYRFILKIG